MSAVEYPKMIVLKQLYGRHDEGRAAEAITPGMLCAYDADHAVIKHATAGGAALKAFAKEDPYQGKTIDDDYAINDVVFLHLAAPGDEIYSLLADGVTTTPDDLLESAGNGAFRLLASGVALARALEEVTADGLTRLKVQVL